MSRIAERLFVSLQHLLPQHFLSRLVLRATRSESQLVKNFLIARFVAAFAPDMADAEEPRPLAYPSFNAFFTRALRAGTRPLSGDDGTVISPVDGTVSQIGTLDTIHILQAKGRSYTLHALLGRDGPWSQVFASGAFATLYLAPYNYHRIHMPLPGTLREAWYVPGRLFSVNHTTAASVDRLFARNERIVCIFEHESLYYAVILVGALFVGSMTTVWHGHVTPRARRGIEVLAPSVHAPHRTLARGEELGRFNMGSTVILLFPPGHLDWEAGITAGTRIRLGQALARLRPGPAVPAP